MANEHIFNNNIRVTGSIFSTAGFIGDGSGITAITASAEWDGSRSGNADITGSLIVSGSSVVVDFTNTSAISGSTFSGSFVGLHSGNGSGLTNLNLNGYQASGSNLSGSFSGSYIGDGSGLTGLNNFPFTGSAVITGSLLVSGSNTTVNFVDVAAISGSVFSGSFVGNGSGLTGVTGTWNGTRLGDANITGSFIVSGSQPTISLLGDTTIDENILISNKNHLKSLTIGSSSLPFSSHNDRQAIAIGHEAGKLLTSGSHNIFIGNEAGMCAIRTEGNIGIGYKALRRSTGNDFGDTVDNVNSRNTAVGTCAMYNLSTGNYNTAFGYQAAAVANSSQGLTVMGYRAGKGHTGIFLTSIGYNSGTSNTQGSYSTSVGADTTGRSHRSVAVGWRALQSLGFGNVNSASPGHNNTAIGTEAGCKVNAQSHGGVFIGNKAGPSSTIEQCNQLYIHNNIGENALLRGDFSTGQLTINSQVSASIFSGSFVGDGSGLSNISGAGFPFNGNAVITGSLHVSQSSASATNTKLEGGHIILTRVSQSLNFESDQEAAAAGVPLGGLYRNENFIQIRIT